MDLTPVFVAAILIGADLIPAFLSGSPGTQGLFSWGTIGVATIIGLVVTFGGGILLSFVAEENWSGGQSHLNPGTSTSRTAVLEKAECQIEAPVTTGGGSTPRAVAASSRPGTHPAQAGRRCRHTSTAEAMIA